MSNDIIVQYVGYQVTEMVREYTFHVREAGEEREFRLSITNEAFVSHRARYQDAPGICAARLQAELTAFSNHPAETQFDITDVELDNYRESRSPKVGQNSWGRKAQEDF
jgi:hypothetical protein